MNIKQLKVNPVVQELGPPMFEKIECDGPKLLMILAKIKNNGDMATSMNLKGTAHYELNVRRKNQ